MNKKLNQQHILNELKGESSFFPKKIAPLPVPASNKDQKPKTQRGSVNKPNGRTVGSNAISERSNQQILQAQDAGESVLQEVVEGKDTEQARNTQRYSFEIYEDQIEAIEDVQYQFKKRTGKKLSSSRFIREAVDAYLAKAQDVLSQDKKGSNR